MAYNEGGSMNNKFFVCLTLVLSLVFAQKNVVKKSDTVRLSPRLLNYQGYLTDTLGNPITNPSISMSFAIFDAVSGGSQKWSETQSSVSVNKGIFNALLGSVTPIPDSVFTINTLRWLELSVGGQTLTPRTRITTVGYAYTATYSDTALFAKTVIPDTDWIIVGSTMHSGVSGNVGIGAASPGERFEVNGNIKVSGSGSGLIFPDFSKQTTAAVAGIPSGGCIMTQSATPPIGYVYTGNYINSVGQDPSWHAKADMPTPRGGFGCAVVNGKIYAIGGWGVSWLQTNEEYDPATNTWATRANMPTARGNLTAGAVNNKIYAIGGANTNGYARPTNEEYDPVSNTWAGKASMPTGRSSLAGAVVNGKIYAIGGWNGSARLQTNEEYDPVSNTWASKANMPTARNSMGVEAVNGKIYAIGGFNGSTNLQTNEEYDPLANTWATKANMPTARCGFSGTICGKIHIISGSPSIKTNEEYDPTTDTWATRVDIPTGRQIAGCTSVNGKIYVIGGLDNLSNPISTNEEYLPGSTTYYIYMKY